MRRRPGCGVTDERGSAVTRGIFGFVAPLRAAPRGMAATHTNHSWASFAFGTPSNTVADSALSSDHGSQLRDGQNDSDRLVTGLSFVVHWALRAPSRGQWPARTRTKRRRPFANSSRVPSPRGDHRGTSRRPRSRALARVAGVLITPRTVRAGADVLGGAFGLDDAVGVVAAEQAIRSDRHRRRRVEGTDGPGTPT